METARASAAAPRRAEQPSTFWSECCCLDIAVLRGRHASGRLQLLPLSAAARRRRTHQQALPCFKQVAVQGQPLPAMAAALPLGLLDLPPDLLIRVGVQLLFTERLQLSLVCRRWRDVCAGPSELWSRVDARIAVPFEAPGPDESVDELLARTLAYSAAISGKLEAYRK